MTTLPLVGRDRKLRVLDDLFDHAHDRSTATRWRMHVALKWLKEEDAPLIELAARL